MCARARVCGRTNASWIRGKFARNDLGKKREPSLSVRAWTKSREEKTREAFIIGVRLGRESGEREKSERRGIAYVRVVGETSNYDPVGTECFYPGNVV